MNKITPLQLESQLSKGLVANYLITGNDLLLQNEVQIELSYSALKQGFDEKFSFIITPQTDWQAITECCQSMGLFSSKTRLILQFPETGLTAEHHNHLNTLSTLLHDDLILILVIPKWLKKDENSRWFKQLNDSAVMIHCATPDINQLPAWIKKRAQQLQLNLDYESIQLLSHYYEGNLLALSQILQQLQLLYDSSVITLPRLEDIIQNAAQFTPYHWLDALLKGKKQRTWHILQQLKQEEIEPIILLRILQKELFLLLAINQRPNSMSLKAAFDQHNVWQNRRALLTEALQRLSLSRLQHLLTKLTQLDGAFKQQSGNILWQGLEALSLHFCQAAGEPFSVLK